MSRHLLPTEPPRLINTPVLETERLILRAPLPEDWPAFAEFMTSDRARFVRPAKFDRGLCWRAFGHIVGHWLLRGFGQFIVIDRRDGTTLGAVGNWYPETWPEPEIGWTIFAAEAEGKGYAKEAARAVVAHSFTTLGWNTAVSYIDPENSRSIALAEALGARHDPAAAAPGTPGTLLVYRHPRPEAA